MIGRVYRGGHVGGLVRYLYGPGRANEHESPHLVAAWDAQSAGDLAALEPGGLVVMPLGQADYRRLVAELMMPLSYADHPVKDPVWHCPLRTAPGDRRLSDEEWGEVARDLMDRTGIAPRGDDGACRWVAVRHDEDSVHVVAVLARQDGGHARVSFDYLRVREVCRVAEEKYELVETAPADSTAARHTTRAEQERATRDGRAVPDRDWLREQVAHAATASRTAPEFVDRLRAGGIALTQRRDRQGVVVGYSVGRRGADGKAAVMFGGGSLARDLSLPRLEARWAAAGGGAGHPGPVVVEGAEREAVWTQAARAASRAAELVRSDPAQGGDAASAAAEILGAASRLIEGEGGGPLSAAARDYDRAARERYRAAPAPSQAGSVLRAAALVLARTNPRRPGRAEAVRVAVLVTQMARLSASIRDLRAAQGRLAQAKAATTHHHRALARGGALD